MIPSAVDNAVILGLTALRLIGWISSVLVNFDEPRDPSWTDGPILASALIDSVFTMEHVEEANAIRQLTETQKFVDAYRGVQIHLPPLGLATIEALPSWIWCLIVLVLDLRIARNLYIYSQRHLEREFVTDTTEEQLQASMDPRILPNLSHVFAIDTKESIALFQWDRLPDGVAQLYFGAASCVALLYPHSFQNIPFFFLTEALVSRSVVSTAFALSASSYLDLHSIVFLVPISLSTDKAKWSLILWTIAFVTILQVFSFLIVGPSRFWKIVAATHLHSFRIAGLRPSLSVLWYFGMQVFRRFQTYFTILLGWTPYTIVAPLTLRLYRYPTVLVAIFWGLDVLFRPPSTLYKLSIFFCFLLMNPRSLARWKPLALVAPFAMTVPVTLYLVTYWLWIVPGNGEANFCFFQCIGYNVMVAGLLINFVGASLRRDKALRLTANHKDKTGKEK